MVAAKYWNGSKVRMAGLITVGLAKAEYSPKTEVSPPVDFRMKKLPVPINAITHIGRGIIFMMPQYRCAIIWLIGV